jgi:acyl carrier protein
MVFEKVRAILMEQLDLEAHEIVMDSSIVDDLGADSLDIVDLVMNLEDEFDAEIPDEAIENLRTVGDVVRFIEENLS